jgi:hypothetical protein
VGARIGPDPRLQPFETAMLLQEEDLSGLGRHRSDRVISTVSMIPSQRRNSKPSRARKKKSKSF